MQETRAGGVKEGLWGRESRRFPCPTLLREPD